MHNRALLLAALFGLIATVPAHAETWSCGYDGAWNTSGSSDKGTFNWQVMWKSTANGGWKVVGDYSDRYGKSILDGICNSRSCLLKQVYESGELQGKQYYWNGNYTDKLNGNTSINRFTGTWGTTMSAKDGGKWRAIATCVKN